MSSISAELAKTACIDRIDIAAYGIEGAEFANEVAIAGNATLTTITDRS